MTDLSCEMLPFLSRRDAARGKKVSKQNTLDEKEDLRKGTGVMRSRGKIVLIQVSEVENDKEQSGTCTESVNKV